MLIDITGPFRGLPAGRYDIRVSGGTLWIFHPGSVMPCAQMTRSSYERAVTVGLIAVAIDAEINPFSVGMLQLTASPFGIKAYVLGRCVAERGVLGHA
jgi:hypothetical protein